MVWHLVRDLVRRNRYSHLVLAPMVVGVWAQAATGQYSVGIAAMVSVFFVCFMGQSSIFMDVGRPEVRVLPVTVRELWLSVWLVVNVVLTLVVWTTIGAAVAIVYTFRGSSDVSLTTLLICASYSFACTGILLPLHGLAPVTATLDRSWSPKAWLAVTTFTVSSMFIVGLGVPLFLWKHLPTSLDEFTPAAMGILVVGWTVAFGSLAWTPHRSSFSGRYVGARPTPLPHGRTSVRAGQLTGISSVLWKQVGMAAAGTIFIIAVSTVMGQVIAPTRDVRFEFFLSAIFVLIVFGSQNPWPQWVRLLKVLPITAGRINLLLLLTPFCTWTVASVLLVGIHVGLGRPLPNGPLVALFFCAAGLTTMSHAVAFRMRGAPVMVQSFIPVLATMGPALGIVALDLQSSSWLRPALIGVTVLSTAVAAALNHWTLTRSSSSSGAYRSPLGQAAAGRIT